MRGFFEIGIYRGKDVRSAIDAIDRSAKAAMPSVDHETGSVTGREP